MIQLKNKARGAKFFYEPTADGGFCIRYGRGWETVVSGADVQQLINHFRGQEVALGTSRDNPPPGSVGAWLQVEVTPVAIASYLGPILVQEGYAEWVKNQRCGSWRAARGRGHSRIPRESDFASVPDWLW